MKPYRLTLAGGGPTPKVADGLEAIERVTRLMGDGSPPRDVVTAILEMVGDLTEATHTAMLVSEAEVQAIASTEVVRDQLMLSSQTSLVCRGELADQIRDWEGASEPTMVGNGAVFPMVKGGIAAVDLMPGFLDVKSKLKAVRVLSQLAAGTLFRAQEQHQARQRTAKLEDTRRRLREQNTLLQELAVVDPLTSLFNRRFFDRRLQYEMERFSRYGKPLGMVLFDVDHFKRVNDSHGHQVGDAVLQHLAEVAKRTVRKVDVLARYGGEEFCVLMVESNATQASIGAERLRAAIESSVVEIDGIRVPVTVSLGVAAAAPGWEGDANALYRSADAALYRAKMEGRNRVVCNAILPLSEE